MTSISNTKINARLRISLQQALSFITLGVLLTGCNLEAHDSIDNHPPGNMPMPESAKIAQKPTRKPIPPPPTEEALGMPIYPNATTYLDVMGTPVPSITTGEARQAMLSTPDSMDKVVAFYASRLTEIDANGASKLATPREMSQKEKRSTVITGNDALGNILMAIIHEDSGKTTIELMHTHAGSMPSSVSGDAKSGGAKPDEKTSQPLSTPQISQTPSSQTPSMSLPNSPAHPASGARPALGVPFSSNPNR